MQQTNVFGEPIEKCWSHPVTGYFRDGFCRTDDYDRGSHTICAKVSQDFLQFSKSRGNDLSTPRPEYQFAGLVDGQAWCLCATRWLEAQQAGVAPRVYLKRTNNRALEIVPIELLREHAADLN